MEKVIEKVRRGEGIAADARSERGVKRVKGWDTTAGRVHLISAITDLPFCQIDADLILSAAADGTALYPVDDNSTGNWRIVR